MDGWIDPLAQCSSPLPQDTVVLKQIVPGLLKLQLPKYQYISVSYPSSLLA